MNNVTYKNFTVTVDARGVCQIVLDVPNRPLNVLDHSVMTELASIVSDLETSDTIKVVVFRSSKESGYLAGADVSAIANIQSPQHAARLIENGQLLFQRIEWLPMKKVVVIHGPCLGGGLEMALACDYIIARDNSSTKIGLPEIKLGVIPGWGGTQRLPKRVGLQNSLSMILQGKHLDAKEALNIGLVDRAIPPEDWADGVEQFIDNIVSGSLNCSPRSHRKWTTRLLDNTSLGRAIVFRATGKKIAAKTKAFPALKSALKAIKSAYVRGKDGFFVERTEFTKLLSTPTCRNLLGLFFAREKARSPKTWTVDSVRAAHEMPIQRVGVIGAGAMGAGIGQLAALRGFDVVIKEVNEDAATQGRRRIDVLINSLANRKGWSDFQRRDLTQKITVTCDDDLLRQSDLIVEAIVERMETKQAVFSELDAMVGQDTILATNTSSLSVDTMAMAVSRPANFGGLHFFNPVQRMELVEIVQGKATSDATVSRLVAFVRAMGKTPIVTSDSPGFLVNRVLFPYLGEAILMVREGYDVAKIDKELRRFGMPMGPLELLDQIGLDVALHVAGSLSEVLSGVEPVVEMLQMMVDDGKLGKKTNAGFYRHSNGRRGEVIELAISTQPKKFAETFLDDSLTPIQRRLVYPMLAEAIKCHEERVVVEAWAIDLAMVLGTGFAPHLGGPLHVADSIGVQTLLTNMEFLQEQCGDRFAPPATLTRMAKEDGSFFETDDTLDHSATTTN
ncbi:3-hydroxyacyl-CoA dehydrogenase NAD-binding domain-containing protein [Planctomycetes bacterium K23_9]|uniref:enoyl-CoA hydratase n=1 Tax=Stieleria marina TaxID=1930275 RepID=A0A517NZI0_9BACT|nr:Fatty acid oxidation complex subunit alpha [Planctomycetes bacterium K23_9]